MGFFLFVWLVLVFIFSGVIQCSEDQDPAHFPYCELCSTLGLLLIV